MASPYDALLEAPKASPYDALLQTAAPPQLTVTGNGALAGPAITSPLSEEESAGLIGGGPSAYGATSSVAQTLAVRVLPEIPKVSAQDLGLGEKGGEITAGLQHVVANAVNAMTNVGGIVTTGAAAATAGLGPIAAKITQGLFAGYMGYQGAKGAIEAKKVLADPNSTLADKVEAVGNSAAAFGAAGFAGFHVANPDVIPSLIKQASLLTPEQMEGLDNLIQQRKADTAGLPETTKAIGESNEKPPETTASAPAQPVTDGRDASNTQAGAEGGLRPALLVNGKAEVALAGESHATIADRVKSGLPSGPAQGGRWSVYNAAGEPVSSFSNEALARSELAKGYPGGSVQEGIIPSTQKYDPAVLMESGKIATGATHESIIKEAAKTGEIPKQRGYIGSDKGKILSLLDVAREQSDLAKRRDSVNAAVADDSAHVFVDEQGNVLDRQQAANHALKTGQITPDQHSSAMARTEAPGLHSEDLNQPKEGEPTNDQNDSNAQQRQIDASEPNRVLQGNDTQPGTGSEGNQPSAVDEEAGQRGLLKSEGPGAASITEPLSVGSQLQQLTETIKGQTEAKPLSERISSALEAVPEITKRKASGIAGDVKTGFQDAILRAKSVGTAISDAFTKLPSYTDFSRAKGEWTGALQKNDLEVRRFAQSIRDSIPNPLKREAITNWIQAGGDDSVLQKRGESLKPVFDDAGNAILSKSKVDQLKKGYEAARSLTDDEKVTASNISSYLDSMLREGMDAGVFHHGGVDDYVTQIWKRPNPVTQQLRGDTFAGKLTTSFKYAKQRVFDSYFEGEQAGYTPATKDIGALMSVYDQSFGRTKAGRAFVKQLQTGTASDGRPLADVSGIATPAKTAAEVPEGPAEPSKENSALLIKPRIKPEEAADYKTIDHPALRGWKWMGADEAGNPILLNGDMIVHPEAVKDLQNMLGTSALRQNPISDFILKGQTTLKQTKLSLSLFHQVQEGLHALWHRVNPLTPEKLDLDNPQQMDLVKHGLQVSDYRAMQQFSEGLSGEGGLLDKVPAIGPVLQRYQHWLFQDYIPGLKMSMALHAQDRNMARYSKELESGKITSDQVAELTAKQANAAFGELNYKYIARNPTHQDIFRIAALAPDFLEARSKFVGQALTKYGAEQRTALALMASAMYVGARMLNKTLDGDYHSEQPFNVQINGTRYGLRTIGGDVENLWNDPRRFIYNRLSPVLRTGVEAITGRNAYGVKRSSLEQMKDFADWIVPITLEKQEGQKKNANALASVGVTSYTPKTSKLSPRQRNTSRRSRR